MTSRQTALRIAKAALESKAERLTLLDLRRISATFDYFVLCSATSQRRSQAIADAVTAALQAQGVRLGHQEGYEDGGWVLLDYGSVIGHIFTEAQRAFYALEHLWGQAPRVRLPAAGDRRRPPCRPLPLAPLR